jgi:type VI protein secretion system component VasF
MALFIRQDDNRSELQRRLAAELREKSKQRAELENKPLPDGVTDSNYMKDFTPASRMTGLWIFIIIAVIAALIIFLMISK